MYSKKISCIICILMLTTFFSADVSEDVNIQVTEEWEARNDYQENIDDIINDLTINSKGYAYANGENMGSGTGGLADSPWPMFRRNLNHTGFSPYDTSSNHGKEKWNFSTNGFVFSSSAIGCDNTIYVGSNDKNLYAIDPNGIEKWNFTTDLYVVSSPAVDSNGTIYVGSSDGNLYAIYPNGTKKWNFIKGPQGGGFSSPTIGSDGTIYIGSSDYKLYAINPDGTEKWSYLTGDMIYSSPAIGSDGTIYIGSNDNKLYAINPDGTGKWSFVTGGNVHSSPAISSDNTIYFGSWDGKLYAVYPNGTEKWSFSTFDKVISSPSIDLEGTIYVGSHDYRLYAINPDGNEKWNFITDEEVYSSPAIGFDGTIYVASEDGKLYGINPDGTKKWSFTTNSEIDSSPAIGSDGTIYIGSNDFKLYAIGSTNIPPIANSGPNQTVIEGDIVQFNSSSSYDPDGTIETYEWDFDSNDGLWWETGVEPDATESSPIHIYGDDGIYIATLRVIDDTGLNGTDICNITVNNVAPTINLFGPFIIDEGSYIMFDSNVTDPGSDDLTFNYDWGDGTSPPTIIYYNDGIGPEPTYDLGINEIKSPDGDYPFNISDSVQHTYGDNGVYLLTLTVEDDDGGVAHANTTVTVNNVAPTVTLEIVPSGDEGSKLIFEADATDPGSDDLKFTWEFGYGPTIENIHHNDGVGPEPIYDPVTNEIKSPWGIYPFNVSDNVNHTYGDDYNYTLLLTVSDDDGKTVTYTCTISINNVAPSIVKVWIPYVAYEGTSVTYGAVAQDNGSDDLTFEWAFGDSTPIIENTYYTDGSNPDPYPSPDGTYPFTASDTLNHTYGDNYNYTLTLKVNDDDGGITTFSTTVYVNNVAPTITPFFPTTIFEEGMPITLSANAKDLGSDDLTFTWEFEHGSTITNTYYNDGVGTDPYPSPWGNFPFNASDEVEHIYGDNGEFYVMLTVTDDDNGTTTFNTTVTVYNVAPVVDTLPEATIDEYGTVTFTAHAKDSGSDDLTFIWNWEYAPWGDKNTIYYNDGIGPDPYPSPTINLRDITEDATCQFGDDGVFTVTLTVTDDDNASTVVTTNVTVNNITPTVTIESAVMDVDIGLRVAGRKYNDVGMILYEDGNAIGNISIERLPGSPDEQMAWILVTMDMTKTYCAIVTFTPEDPPDIGGNPIWLCIKFENGTEKRIHHTFNVQQSKKRDSDHWNHVEPWEVELNVHLVGHAFEITSHITDPGSDDEFLTLTYGSQTVTVIYLNDPSNPDPYPSPEVSPKDIIDTITLIYEGAGTVTLIVKDDDNIRFGVGQGSDCLDVM